MGRVRSVFGQLRPLSGQNVELLTTSAPDLGSHLLRSYEGEKTELIHLPGQVSSHQKSHTTFRDMSRKPQTICHFIENELFISQ